MKNTEEEVSRLKQRIEEMVAEISDLKIQLREKDRVCALWKKQVEKMEESDD